MYIHFKDDVKSEKRNKTSIKSNKKIECFYPYCEFTSSTEKRLIKHIHYKHNRIKPRHFHHPMHNLHRLLAVHPAFLRDRDDVQSKKEHD